MLKAKIATALILKHFDPVQISVIVPKKYFKPASRRIITPDQGVATLLRKRTHLAYVTCAYKLSPEKKCMMRVLVMQIMHIGEIPLGMRLVL